MANARKSSKSATPAWNAEAVKVLSTVSYFFVDAASGAIVPQPGLGILGFAIMLRSYQGGAEKVAVCSMYVAQKNGREAEGQDTRKILLTSAAGHTGYGIPVPGSVVIGPTADASWTLPVAGAVLGKLSEFAGQLAARRLAA